jgi:hypothetical protein
VKIAFTNQNNKFKTIKFNNNNTHHKTKIIIIILSLINKHNIHPLLLINKIKKIKINKIKINKKKNKKIK